MVADGDGLARAYVQDLGRAWHGWKHGHVGEAGPVWEKLAFAGQEACLDSYTGLITFCGPSAGPAYGLKSKKKKQ